MVLSCLGGVFNERPSFCNWLRINWRFFALCIKKEHKDAIIIGFDINREQARLAKMLGVIDEIAENS